MADLGKAQRDFYTKQLALLEERRAAVEFDLETVSREEERLALMKKGEAIAKKTDEISAKLAELDSNSPDQNVRDRNLEKILQKINFAQAKKTAVLIREKLDQDGGSVLFFLRKSKKQMGDYCIKEVIDVIMSDQMIDGQIVGAYKPIPIDLGSAISQYNETEFLIRIASYFNVETSTSLQELSQQIRRKILSSFDIGTTIFLQIKSLDDLLEQEEFLTWFIEKFWKPLIDEVTSICKKYKSKFIVALIADSQISFDCSTEYFCDDGTFDCYKMLELPLPNWTVEDIQDWLIRFRTLSAVMKEKTDADLIRVAGKIHRDSEGTPQNICANLRDYFL